MLVALLGLLTGPLGKYLAYAGIIGTLLLAGWGWLKEKEYAAAQAALAQFNAQQLAQNKADEAAAKAQLAQVTASEVTLQAQVDAANKAAEDNTAAIEKWLNDQVPQPTPIVINKVTGKPTCGLNPIYNQTLRKLKGVKGTKKGTKKVKSVKK